MGATGTAGELPEGTVTFLFTDLEGSTALLEAHPAAYRDAVRRHHDLLREAVEAQGGVVFETVGDAVYAAFARPTAAVAAALAGQRALQQEGWGRPRSAPGWASTTGRWSARRRTTSGRRCTAAPG
jgi:class 3 adenylate cyclase